jgi:hypothetical protein
MGKFHYGELGAIMLMNRILRLPGRWRARVGEGGEERAGGFLKVIPTVGEDCGQEGKMVAVEGQRTS